MNAVFCLRVCFIVTIKTWPNLFTTKVSVGWTATLSIAALRLTLTAVRFGGLSTSPSLYPQSCSFSCLLKATNIKKKDKEGPLPWALTSRQDLPPTKLASLLSIILHAKLLTGRAASSDSSPSLAGQVTTTKLPINNLTTQDQSSANQGLILDFNFLSVHSSSHGLSTTTTVSLSTFVSRRLRSSG